MKTIKQKRKKTNFFTGILVIIIAIAIAISPALLLEFWVIPPEYIAWIKTIALLIAGFGYGLTFTRLTNFIDAVSHNKDKDDEDI
jgi:uncharacterized membrane protein